ncbi:MAG: hypothetical protein P4M14_06760 [Gammaproteobacteria bacterium]|nr:hypothetical protein [Gammaproteobacteria bacterium]
MAKIKMLPEVKALLDKWQFAMATLKETELPPLTQETDLKDFNQPAGLLHLKENPALYEQNAALILDYIAAYIPKTLQDIIFQYDDGIWGTGKLSLALHSHCKKFINPTYNYLDYDSCVPFILSERIYRKMQWMEWVLIKASELIQPRESSGLKTFAEKYIKSRLSATTARLTEYAAKHQLKRLTIQELEENFDAEQRAKAAAKHPAAPKEEKHDDEIKAPVEQSSSSFPAEPLVSPLPPSMPMATISIPSANVNLAPPVSIPAVAPSSSVQSASDQGPLEQSLITREQLIAEITATNQTIIELSQALEEWETNNKPSPEATTIVNYIPSWLRPYKVLSALNSSVSWLTGNQADNEPVESEQPVDANGYKHLLASLQTHERKLATLQNELAVLEMAEHFDNDEEEGVHEPSPDNSLGGEPPALSPLARAMPPNNNESPAPIPPTSDVAEESKEENDEEPASPIASLDDQQEPEEDNASLIHYKQQCIDELKAYLIQLQDEAEVNDNIKKDKEINGRTAYHLMLMLEGHHVVMTTAQIAALKKGQLKTILEKYDDKLLFPLDFIDLTTMKPGKARMAMALEQYIIERHQKSILSRKSYYHFWSKWLGHPAFVKTMAASKLVRMLNDAPTEELTDQEISALKSAKLGKIIQFYEKHIAFLPVIAEEEPEAPKQSTPLLLQDADDMQERKYEDAPNPAAPAPIDYKAKLIEEIEAYLALIQNEIEGPEQNEESKVNGLAAFNLMQILQGQKIAMTAAQIAALKTGHLKVILQKYEDKLLLPLEFIKPASRTPSKERMIQELEKYIIDRHEQSATAKTPYYHFWSKWSGYPAAVKTLAASKMIHLLKGIRNDDKDNPIQLTDDEVGALRDSDLGKIVRFHEKHIQLPKEFLQAEHRKIIHQSAIHKRKPA